MIGARQSTVPFDRHSYTRQYIRWIIFLGVAMVCFYVYFLDLNPEFSVIGLQVSTAKSSQATDMPTDTIEIVPTSGSSAPSQQQGMSVSKSNPSLPFSESTVSCENMRCYRNRSSVEMQFGSKVQFIFPIGLEGTGHHWLEAIIEDSPAMERLKQYNISPTLTDSLKQLSSLNPRPGPDHRLRLMNSHCFADNKNNDPSKTQETLVSLMKEIDSQANNNINGGRLLQQGNLNENTLPIHFGGQSYPSNRGDCRSLNYPDLNLYYDTCQRARVDCLHFYLYRHPVEVLNSVVSRGFSDNDTSGMQLYIMNLHVLASQLRNHSNRTLGCFNFFTSHVEAGTWQDAQLDLWDWRDESERYDNFLSENFKAPSSNNNVVNAAHLETWLNDPMAGPYIKSWWKLHNHVVATCQKAVIGG